jgi:hypothetical protein
MTRLEAKPGAKDKGQFIGPGKLVEGGVGRESNALLAVPAR